MKLRIGSTLPENNVVPVSMMEVTGLPFRLLCREQGAGCVVTEMVSAKATLYNSRNTKELLQIHPQKRPAAVRLFSSDLGIMGKIAARTEDEPYDFIDVNMGCPAPKIVNNGEDPALMRDPKKAGEILTATVKAVKKPVTVKSRKGFNDSCIDGMEFARMAKSCGVAAVTTHGRTREQYYLGRVDWNIIRRVKEAVKIPVIRNGDIFTPQDAKRMMEETGCGDLMVVRGAKGNPWIFRRINHYLDVREPLPEPSIEEIREMVLHHGHMPVEYKGESTAMRETRGHIAWYAEGVSHFVAPRNEINQVETLEGFVELPNQRIPVGAGGKDGSHSRQSSYFPI